MLPVPQLESEFTYLHVITTAVVWRKTMIQMLLCFHRKLYLGQCISLGKILRWLPVRTKLDCLIGGKGFSYIK